MKYYDYDFLVLNNGEANHRYMKFKNDEEAINYIGVLESINIHVISIMKNILDNGVCLITIYGI